VSTYSPNGRVFQVEYAAKAVEKSSTALGIRCIDGVVLACEKQLLGKMAVQKSGKRIHTIDLYNGLAMSGMTADARQLVNKARSEALEYKNLYGSYIDGKTLAERVAGFIHTYTLYWYLRPFGCSILLANYDLSNKQSYLYSIDPSGTLFSYYAFAIGRHTQAAKSELEKIDFTKITCDEAVKRLAEIIVKTHDELKDKELAVEMSWCNVNHSSSNGKHVPVPDEIINQAIDVAKEAKRKEEMEDDEEDDK